MLVQHYCMQFPQPPQRLQTQCVCLNQYPSLIFTHLSSQKCPLAFGERISEGAGVCGGCGVVVVVEGCYNSKTIKTTFPHKILEQGEKRHTAGFCSY